MKTFFYLLSTIIIHHIFTHIVAILGLFLTLLLEHFLAHSKVTMSNVMFSHRRIKLDYAFPLTYGSTTGKNAIWLSNDRRKEKRYCICLGSYYSLFFIIVLHLWRTIDFEVIAKLKCCIFTNNFFLELNITLFNHFSLISQFTKF